MASKVVRDPISGKERVVVIMPSEQSASQSPEDANKTEETQRAKASNYTHGGEKKISSN